MELSQTLPWSTSGRSLNQTSLTGVLSLPGRYPARLKNTLPDTNSTPTIYIAGTVS